MAFNILIVDDSPAMRRVIRRVVEMSGVDVGSYFEAANGVEAIEALQKDWIDLVLTDINMPEMSGEQLLTEIRRDAMLSAIPVLVVSTDSTNARLHQMLSLGADGYIAKPFQPATLSEEMSRLLGGDPNARA